MGIGVLSLTLITCVSATPPARYRFSDWPESEVLELRSDGTFVFRLRSDEGSYLEADGTWRWLDRKLPLVETTVATRKGGMNARLPDRQLWLIAHGHIYKLDSAWSYIGRAERRPRSEAGDK